MGRHSLVEKRRGEILEAFWRRGAKDGLHKASIRKIASEAGMAPGIIHHYFKSRDELVEELVSGSATEHIATFRNSLTGTETAEELIDRALEYLFGPALFNDDAGSLFYDFWSEAKRNANIRASFSRVYQRFRAMIVEFLSETGLFRSKSAEQLEGLASMIIAMYEGSNLQWDMDRSNVSLEKMSAMVKSFIVSHMDRADAGDIASQSVN